MSALNSIEILGVSEREGVFEGHAYHNLYLHTAEPFNPDYGYGQKVEFHKVRWSDCVSLFEVAGSNLMDLIGRRVVLNYNKYGNVSSVTIVK